MHNSKLNFIWSASTLMGCLIIMIPDANAQETVSPTPTALSRSENEHPPARPLGPPEPSLEEPGRFPSLCAEERCEGTIPGGSDRSAKATSGPKLAIARTGKRTRGSNTSACDPQNLTLADVDADGRSDFIQTASNKLFVSKTNFEKTGITHLYAHRPIKRVLTGDFHGDRYDQTCTITDDNALICYGISTDRHELWWWFTQGSFLADDEDAIVGDYDADGRDDVLVYSRTGGAFRMYSVKGDAFFAATPKFNQGNLAGSVGVGIQVRAGDFNGDGRDDILLVNRFGQILSFTSVFDGNANTFWWGFTTVGLVSTDDQVTVARVDDNAVDDVVLHNRVTGATRFHRLQWDGTGGLPRLSISTGQISPSGNTVLFWGFMHGDSTEPGNRNRDDAMVYDRGSFVRSDARWDGAQLTYWWAYTQAAPNNQAGWAPFEYKPWLMLKCKFSGVSTEPRNDQFYRDLMFSGGGLTQYYRDISYGSWDLSNSRVVDAWQNMSITNAAWRALAQRYDRAGSCISAYPGSTAGYLNVISIVNGEGDAGNAGGRVLATPDSSNLTFLAHETGHTFGWGHSYDDTARKNSTWSAPGEYFDYWDIMSAMAVHSFSHALTGTAGPEMNAEFKTHANFIPPHRQLRLSPSGSTRTARISVAAINRPEGNGPLMVRIGDNDNEFLTVEYRMKAGWDQGIPRNTVLVHRVKKVDGQGRPYLLTIGSTERLPPNVYNFALGGRNVSITVSAFASEGYTADVVVDY